MGITLSKVLTHITEVYVLTVHLKLTGQRLSISGSWQRSAICPISVEPLQIRYHNITTEIYIERIPVHVYRIRICTKGCNSYAEN